MHVRRADMQGVDAFLHADPTAGGGVTKGVAAGVRGLAMVFNPTNVLLKMNLTLPLYYTGLTDVAEVSQQGGVAVKLVLDRGYNIVIPLDMAPMNITWYVIK